MHTLILAYAIERLSDSFIAKLGKSVRGLVSVGLDLIDLGQGNSYLQTPGHIVKALQQAAEKPINHKYSPFQGFPYFRPAVADFYKREYNVDLDPDREVALMLGSKIGLFEVSLCLLNTGDTALLTDPGYSDYLSGMALANR